MSNKIILDLCGGTGSWSRPWKEAGYDVRVITLPKYDVRTYEPPGEVFGILAAPPCTEFSVLNCIAAPRERDETAGPGRGKPNFAFLHKNAWFDIPQLSFHQPQTDAEFRAMTPPGFANAFFEANKGA